MSRKTYTIKHGPERPSSDEYSRRVSSDFAALLQREPAIHRFLDRTPSLVPGAQTPGGPVNGLLHGALITQPKLPGFRSRVPDFMWIVADSATWYPTLIEIESPTKKLFTRAGVPRAEFTQARNQLTQWRAWFQSPTNVQQFIELYDIPARWRNFMGYRLRMILVYGRRAEFETLPELSIRTSCRKR
jgi:hypothetical protein